MIAPPGRSVCRFCGVPIDPILAARGGVCAARPCQARRVQEASRAVFQRQWDDYVGRQRDAIGRAMPAIAEALRQLGARPGEVAIGVVPRVDRPLAPVPAEQRAAFEAWLDEIIAAAFAEPVPEIDLDNRAREEAAELPLISATCATCQGLCCTRGGPKHAFLTVSDMQLFRLRHPEAEAEAVRAYYLERIPERTVEHACVFQSEAGCSLDRADRADVCNRYHCNPQTQLLNRMREMKAEKAVIIAQEGAADVVVSTFDERTGLHRFGDPDSDAPAPDPEEVAAALDAALAQVPPPLTNPPSTVPPPSRNCEFCGAELDHYRAVTSRCCGEPACEQARVRKLAREATGHDEGSPAGRATP